MCGFKLKENFIIISTHPGEYYTCILPNSYAEFKIVILIILMRSTRILVCKIETKFERVTKLL